MNKTWIDIPPGDAVIYKGCDIEHEKSEFKGDGQSQVFCIMLMQMVKIKIGNMIKTGCSYPQTNDYATLRP